MGIAGSYAADLLRQTFGLGSYFLVLILIAWAWRVASLRGLSPILWRLVTAVFTLASAALSIQMLLKGLGGKEAFLHMPPGGFLGELFHNWLHHAGLGQGLMLA